MELSFSNYNPNTKEIVGIHESGFYSCINCVRISLYKLISNNIIPEKISFRETLNSYKSIPNFDLYPLLYKTDYSKISNIDTNFEIDIFCPTLLQHNRLNLEKLIPIEKVYFTPSDEVVSTINYFKEKYNIVPENTLAVLHRGNDKWRETILSSVDFWIKIIESKYKPGQKILIQTDQESARQQFIDHFRDRCFFIEEMIFEDHINANVRPTNNKETWAIQFESIMRIISECSQIINHTGNCALIPILYRGTLDGEVQIFNNVAYDYSKSVQ